MSRERDQAEVQRVGVDQLRVGVFISLAERWMDHPFLFNEFRITSEKQIQTLREMGLDTVQYMPARSTVPPLDPPERPRAPRPPPPPPTAEEVARLAEKRQRMERVGKVRERLARCEKLYSRNAGEVRDLMQRLHASPRIAADTAHELVGDTVTSLLGEQDMVLHLLGQKGADENAYFHALNVMILSLLLGKSIGLKEESLRDLGLGALFHDLGKRRIPDPVLRKGSARSRVEEEFYRLHPLYGEEAALETGAFSPAALDVIRHHHEHLDGSGFPDKLSGERIGRLARIVGIANRYDSLCNAGDNGMTPAEVLSQMYRKELGWWDERLLSRFIKSLGVYPPGSIVQLSNGAIGLVLTVNHADLLRPSVMLYDAAVSRREANIVDLMDVAEVKIERALRRDAVGPEVLDYLAPRRQLSFLQERSAGG